MPPRKSTSSIPPTDNEANSPTTAAGGAQVTEQQLKAQAEGVSVEDLLLPRSVTQRLAKSVLPPNTTIQKDALLAIQKAATVFVSYLSSHANEATLKRTLAPADILSALSELEFDSLRPRLERELDAHTEAQADKKKAKEKKAATSVNGTDLNNKEEGAAAVEDSEKKGSGDNKQQKEKTTSTTLKGNKRVKRDSDGNEKSGVSADETELEEPDDDETEEEEEEEEDDDDDDNNEDEDEEENDADGNETQSAEDLDRVEDLDARMQGPDDDSASDEDDDGPAAQLRSNMGLG